MSDRNPRAIMLMAALEHVPPMLRARLLREEKIRHDFGLATKGVVTFREAGVTFLRSKFFAAVRKASSAKGTPQTVADETGVEWTFSTSRSSGGSDLVLVSGDRVMHASQLLLLSTSRGLRLSAFAEQAKKLGLPDSVTKRWRGILTKRPITEAEVNNLLADAAHSTVLVSSTIRARIASKNISLSEIVPKSLDYYERLVGAHSGQANIHEYVEHVLVAHIDELMKPDTPENVHSAMLLASHASIVELIGKHMHGPLAELLRWALRADPIAQCGALEIAIAQSAGASSDVPELRALLERFVEGVGMKANKPFTVLAAAFVMVDGELAKSRLMAGKPAFWRRLAALAQAALVTRVICSESREFGGLIDWMASVRAGEHEMQSFIDLRTEPRWLSGFGDAEQLQNELGGRVLSAAKSNEATFNKSGLGSIVFQDGSESLSAKLNLLRAFLPGPLEGNVESSFELDSEHVVELRKRLEEPEPSVSAFLPLANAALVLKMPRDILDLAASAIRRAQYRLEGGQQQKLHASLLALACLSAAERHLQLADELFVLIRNYRRFIHEELPITAAFAIGMHACASRVEFQEWCRSVGSLVADLSFGELTKQEAQWLHRVALTLCELVPELWASCGKGLAAIECVAAA